MKDVIFRTILSLFIFGLLLLANHIVGFQLTALVVLASIQADVAAEKRRN
jgi:hypothetical protein